MTTHYTIFTSNGGHSAKSPGASGCGYKEHEQARLISAEFIKAMKERGYNVTDTTSDAANKAAVLQEQVAKANKAGKGSNVLHLSWHLNASTSKTATGTEVYHYGEATKELAAEVSATLAKTLGIRDRGGKQNQKLAFLRATTSHAILIEVCFISNESDMESLQKKRADVANAVANLLVGTSGSSTKPSTVSTPSTAKSDYNSLVDYIKAQGGDSSFSNRAKLAVKYGIVKDTLSYHGTAEQNTRLLKAMRDNQ